MINKPVCFCPLRKTYGSLTGARGKKRKMSSGEMHSIMSLSCLLFVTSTSLYCFTLNISGGNIGSQLNRKPDFLILFNHTTINGLSVLEPFFKSAVSYTRHGEWIMFVIMVPISIVLYFFSTFLTSLPVEPVQRLLTSDLHNQNNQYSFAGCVFL